MAYVYTCITSSDCQHTQQYVAVYGFVKMFGNCSPK